VPATIAACDDEKNNSTALAGTAGPTWLSSGPLRFSEEEVRGVNAEPKQGRHGRMRPYLLLGIPATVLALSCAVLVQSLARIPVEGATLTVVRLDTSEKSVDPRYGDVHCEFTHKSLRGATVANVARIGERELLVTCGSGGNSENDLVLRVRHLLGDDFYSGRSSSSYLTPNLDSVEFLVREGNSYYLAYGDELILARFEVVENGETVLAECVVKVGPPDLSCPKLPLGGGG
jgi:hypothetical protein